MTYIFIHGSGHKASSWNETISHMSGDKEILCPDLSSILGEKEASYANLYVAFVEYCNEIDGKINLCGLSLGGVLALNYALDFPDKVNKLVLIGAPHKMPRLVFGIQTVTFKLLPKSFFEKTAFDKKDMFIFGNSIKTLDFSDRVKNISCPTLIICGEKDSAYVKSAYYFADNIKHATLKILKHSGMS